MIASILIEQLLLARQQVNTFCAFSSIGWHCGKNWGWKGKGPGSRYRPHSPRLGPDLRAHLLRAPSKPSGSMVLPCWYSVIRCLFSLKTEASEVSMLVHIWCDLCPGTVILGHLPYCQKKKKSLHSTSIKSFCLFSSYLITYLIYSPK
jgi:hypothetical protein